MENKVVDLRDARRRMRGWGLWRGERELLRGAFHASAGIAGWVALHIFGISLELGGVLLFGVGTALFLADQFRVWLNREGVDETTLLGTANQWVAKYWFRDTEAKKPSNITTSLCGFMVTWLVCWLANAPWVAAASCVLFSLVDPFAKLGQYWPIERYENGKSLGGVLCGFLAGALGCTGIILVHVVAKPFFPPGVQAWQMAVIYFFGTVCASYVEFESGKVDNFFIPACSSIIMVLFCAITRIL